VDVTTLKFKQRLSLFNRFCPTFAICAHPTAVSQLFEKYEVDHNLKSSKAWLGSVAYLHDGVKEWLPRFFAGLAVLQPIESQFRAELAAPLLGGRPDRSRRPGRESQKSLDDMLYVEGSIFAPEGKQQSKWIGTGEFEEIIEKWERSDVGLGFAGKDGLTIETPFGDETAILLLKTDAPHPRLGNGLLAILKIPLLSEPERANEFCIELNYLEERVWQGPAFIGNWCANETLQGGRGFGPAFSCFMPNLVYRPGLAENLVLYAIRRAQWVRHTWLPHTIDLPMHEILSKRLKPH
jgi:hypothetical protein